MPTTIKLHPSDLTALAAAVRSAREKAGLSVAQLAAAVGLTEGAVRFLESGRNACSVATLLAVARACDVRPSRLLAPLDRRPRNNSENP